MQRLRRHRLLLLAAVFLGINTRAFYFAHRAYLTPHTVIRTLWQVPLAEFSHAWSEVVHIYCSRSARYQDLRYVCVLARHCAIVHEWLMHLYVDPLNECLAYTPNYCSAHTFVSIHAYWKAQRNEEAYLFYACYFDWLARLFIAAVYEASVIKKQNYSALQQAESYCSELHMIHGYLVGSEYERRYARQLRRYQELLELVRDST